MHAGMSRPCLTLLGGAAELPGCQPGSQAGLPEVPDCGDHVRYPQPHRPVPAHPQLQSSCYPVLHYDADEVCELGSVTCQAVDLAHAFAAGSCARACKRWLGCAVLQYQRPDATGQCSLLGSFPPPYGVSAVPHIVLLPKCRTGLHGRPRMQGLFCAGLPECGGVCTASVLPPRHASTCAGTACAPWC